MRTILCFLALLITFEAGAQNVDSTFKGMLFRMPAPNVLDEHIYSIEQSDNLSILFVNSQSFYFTVFDLKPYFLNLVNKKTKQKIPLLHGRAKFEKDITYDYFLNKEKELKNALFSVFRLYSPEIKHFNIFDPQYTNSDKVFNGRVTIVHVWEYGCGPCMEEIQRINDLADSLKGSDVQIIGLHRGLVVLDKGRYAFSRGGDVPEAISVHFPQYPINDTMMKKIGIITFPSTYILDKHGIIRTLFTGSLDPRLIKPILQSLPFYSMYE